MICCKECLELLHDYLEGALSPNVSASLEEHFGALLGSILVALGVIEGEALRWEAATLRPQCRGFYFCRIAFCGCDS